MVVDLRYHIFTITAIFAALGLGILIGTSVIGNEGLIKEQNKIISNIGKNIDKLKAENNKLKKSISNLEEKLDYRKKIETELLSLVLNNEFRGKKYLLFTSNNEKIDQIKELLKTAGAELEIYNNIEDLKAKADNKKIILWNMLDNIDRNIKNNAVIYNKSDIMGLILTLMESERNENDKKECISNNPGL